ncbi:MAG: insulinase family protein [Gammaproteobacteria bacterium]|nr:MAG: insulinase family protein [Gammaproteobacteria bacterium]
MRLFALLLGLAALPLAAADLNVAPIAFKQRTLANGLQVIQIEDHTSPTVAVQVWYHVGSKNDPAGRSGFAHLFEHLMFKSTKNLKAEQFDRLTEDVGGQNNATTNDDFTNYFEAVPSNHLERLLWAEAERMANLNVDEANFKSERAVVEEELRQRVLATPYGRLFNAVPKDAYLVHPYKRPGIGSIEELDAAALADVIAFHRTFYRPDFATLIVAGDFIPGELDKWVDAYFAPLQKPAAAIPQVKAVEADWSKDRRYEEHGPNVPLPAVVVAWLAPPAKNKDSVALEVAAALLANGESSRLHQALVYRQQIAQSANFSSGDSVDKGLLYAFAIVASGHKPEEVETALLAEISNAATQPIAAPELDKVKTKLVTQTLSRRQTAEGKAFAIGTSVLLKGDADSANSDLDALQKVTAADVQRVLKKYALDAHRVTINYTQQAETKPAAAAAKGATP